jgi:hypothetical protein
MLCRKDKSVIPVRNRNYFSIVQFCSAVVTLTELSQLFDNEMSDEIKVLVAVGSMSGYGLQCIMNPRACSRI